MFALPNITYVHRHQTIQLSEREGHSMPHIPMVYERVNETPAKWEYHVLQVDTRERELPDAVILNELGNEGWILAGVVEQHEHGQVLFYFVRQSV